MRNRYPGPRPFQTDESAIFFGRDDEIKRITQQLRLSNLIVIHGRSGVGKTSLLNAGVIPTFLNQSAANGNPVPKVVQVRFGSWFPDSVSLEEMFKQFVERTPSLLDQLEYQDSVWSRLKSQQLNLPPQTEFLLVFDQFEEIATYPDQDFEYLTQVLTRLTYPKVPVEIQEAIRQQQQIDPDQFTPARLRQFLNPLQMRIVLIIRSDRLGILDRFRPSIARILQYSTEVQPLTKSQAKDALLAPAAEQGGFYSTTFSFELEALEKILAYVAHEETDSMTLQLIASSVERATTKIQSQSVSGEMVGNPEDLIANILTNSLDGLDETESEAVKRAVVDSLIQRIGRGFMRLSMHEAQLVERFGIDKVTLDRMTRHGVLRAVPFIRGGVTYEISSDRLVPVILLHWDAAQSSVSNEEILYEELELARKKQQELHEQQYNTKEAIQDLTSKLRFSVRINFLLIIAILILLWFLLQRT
ncbi:MAG: ATP-binding protein [Bacteroidota bacterium]